MGKTGRLGGAQAFLPRSPVGGSITLSATGSVLTAVTGVTGDTS